MLVLASASPRRAALLRQAGIPFTPRPAEVDERHPGPLAEAVAVLARQKAEGAAEPDGWTLGADTLVVLDGEAIGKPADAAEAERILARLAGRSHEVATGVAVRDPAGRWHEGREVTRVTFAPLAAEAIRAYVATGEPLGKAGAYAIQGAAEAFVVRLEGSWSNVVGLPLALAVRLLAEAEFPLPPHLRAPRKR